MQDKQCFMFRCLTAFAVVACRGPKLFDILFLVGISFRRRIWLQKSSLVWIWVYIWALNWGLWVRKNVKPENCTAWNQFKVSRNVFGYYFKNFPNRCNFSGRFVFGPLKFFPKLRKVLFFFLRSSTPQLFFRNKLRMTVFSLLIRFFFGQLQQLMRCAQFTEHSCCKVPKKQSDKQERDGPMLRFSFQWQKIV